MTLPGGVFAFSDKSVLRYFYARYLSAEMLLGEPLNEALYARLCVLVPGGTISHIRQTMASVRAHPIPRHAALRSLAGVIQRATAVMIRRATCRSPAW